MIKKNIYIDSNIMDMTCQQPLSNWWKYIFDYLLLWVKKYLSCTLVPTIYLYIYYLLNYIHLRAQYELYKILKVHHWFL